jgi:hypothetical protein
MILLRLPPPEIDRVNHAFETRPTGGLKGVLAEREVSGNVLLKKGRQGRSDVVDWEGGEGRRIGIERVDALSPQVPVVSGWVEGDGADAAFDFLDLVGKKGLVKVGGAEGGRAGSEAASKEPEFGVVSKNPP